MKKITGITAETPQNLLLNAGAFFKNYTVKTDTPESVKAKLIGATQGGGSFNAVPNVRKIEMDGSSGNVKGLNTIDDWAVTMVANVKEVTVNNLKLALGAAKSESTTAPAGYTKISGKVDFDDSDYVENITWVGTLKGSDKPVIIVLKNAISFNGLNLTVADKGEAVIPITLTGNYDPDHMDELPFEIYYPSK